MKKNIEWIDIAKGFGILTVVAGHIYEGDIRRIIFIFHMPLFFFISGYLFKPDLNRIHYFKKKSYNLLVPYIAFLLPIYFLFNFSSVDFNNVKETVIFFVKPIIGGNFLINECGVFWFITTLFFTQQIMNLLMKRFSERIIIGISVFFLILSYINSLFFSEIWFPLNINVVLASFPIFFTGYLFKKYKPQVKDFILLLSGITVIASSFFIPDNIYDMKYSSYGIPVVTLISSIVLTLNVKQLSVFLSRFDILKKVFSKFGEASLVIMFLHQPFQLLIKSYVTEDATFRFIFASIVSFAFYYIFTKNSYLRAIFLGSKADFEKINRNKK